MFKTNNARLSLMASIFAIIITLIGIFCVDNNQNVNAESMDIYMNQDEVDEELLEKYAFTAKKLNNLIYFQTKNVKNGEKFCR